MILKGVSMDKDKVGWLKSLAALLNEKPDELVRKARVVQPDLQRIDDVDECAYYYIVGMLLAAHDIEVGA